METEMASGIEHKRDGTQAVHPALFYFRNFTVAHLFFVVQCVVADAIKMS